MNTLYWILWPAFMVAALATGFLVFTVDPQDIRLAGHPIRISNMGAYSLGFFVLWFVAAASSLMTRFLQRDDIDTVSARVNERATGVPKILTAFR
jgi:hypothetical protein